MDEMKKRIVISRAFRESRSQGKQSMVQWETIGRRRNALDVANRQASDRSKGGQIATSLATSPPRSSINIVGFKTNAGNALITI